MKPQIFFFSAFGIVSGLLAAGSSLVDRFSLLPPSSGYKFGENEYESWIVVE